MRFISRPEFSRKAASFVEKITVSKFSTVENSGIVESLILTFFDKPAWGADFCKNVPRFFSTIPW